MIRRWNILHTLFTTLTLLCCFAAPSRAQYDEHDRDSFRSDLNMIVVTTQVLFEGIVSGAPAQRLTLTIYDSQGFAIRTTEVKSGEWVRIRVPKDVYSISYRGEKWLGRRIAVSTTPARGNITVLPAGDANGDNIVDWADMDIMADAYLSDPSCPHWDSRADLDCDGDVDDVDADLMCYNLYMRGD
jgi:hypothetical protein